MIEQVFIQAFIVIYLVLAVLSVIGGISRDIRQNKARARARAKKLKESEQE